MRGWLAAAGIVAAVGGLGAAEPDRTAEQAMPPEVAAFIDDRALCDHFRDEPHEGDGAAAEARRAFIRDSLDIHCAGSDRRLAALKRRHADDARVLAALAGFETPIEPPCE